MTDHLDELFEARQLLVRRHADRIAMVMSGMLASDEWGSRDPDYIFDKALEFVCELDAAGGEWE